MPFALLGVITICLIGVVSVSAMAADPFEPFSDGAPPEVLRVISEEPLAASDAGPAVVVKKLIFRARSVVGSDGRPDDSEIFAVVARPAATGRYPGMLVLHGGAGRAEEARAIAWARHGYVSVAPDLPGIAEPKGLKYTKGPGLGPYGQGRFTAQPDLTYSTIFTAVVAGIRALDMLRAQPETDAQNVGVTGMSWGGYSSTMVTSLAGDRVKAGFSLYGSGYYEDCTFNGSLQKMPEADRALWLQYLDAGRRAPQMKAHFFIAAGTNDNFFYPPAVMKTLSAIPGDHNHLLAANDDHACRVPGGTETKGSAGYTGVEQIYFDYFLKGQGRPLPRVTLTPPEVSTDGGVTIRFTVTETGVPITTATIWYSEPGVWKTRKWHQAVAIPSSQASRTFEALLPAAATSLDLYASVSDTRPVTVSSVILHIPAPGQYRTE